MRASQTTFKIISKAIGFLATCMLVLAVMAMFMGDELALPWYEIPTYVKAPLFLEYFQINDQAFGLIADQVLAWQHFSTGAFTQLTWPDYLLLGTFLLGLIIISVTLTYLHRSWYLFCTGLMLLVIMQLNLSELGFLPDYIGYISLVLFGGSTYYFNSIKTGASLALRTLSITILYLAAAAAIGLLAPIIVPASATVSFGLFAPLILAVLLMLFVGGDTVQVLFGLATKSSPKGKNGLIHFVIIGLIYLLLLILLFLEKTGNLTLDIWVINPYMIFMIGLICGHLSHEAKFEISGTALPTELITRWLYPALAALSLSLIAYAELTGNDSLTEVLEMCILATHLSGAAVFFVYALINFIPQLLTDEKVSNFYGGFRAPLLTARVLQVVFIAGIFFYLDSQPYYQARAARYMTLGMLGEHVESDLLAQQYYKQANFYDYYNFKANYALARIARKEGNDAEFVDFMKLAAIREKEGKATVALANFYSDKEQLFSKLLTLKKARKPEYRQINNLGIAHYEFNQYDSSLMAFNRSLSLKSTETTLINKLALRYYTAFEWEDEANGQGIKLQINQQAIANKEGSQTVFDHTLATDTLLYQEDMFHLYNQGLNRNLPDAGRLIEAYEYYLSNRKNTTVREFLYLGHALQCYENGSVNMAVKSMTELLAIDPRNRARNAFTLGLWAAQQQAPNLANEYLDMAISGQYRVDDARLLKTAISNGAVPEPPRDNVLSPPSGLNKEQLKSYEQLAEKNAFDIRLTLNAISVLKSEGVQANEIYELLRKAIVINPYSLELVESYAWQSIEAGLAAQGRNGLMALEGKVSEVELERALSEFDHRVSDWRNRADEF